MTIELRPYQNDVVVMIRTAFASYRRVLAVASTGAGKTVIFCYIALHAALKGKRIVIVAHRVEIVRQISEALTRMGIRHGRIQAGHTMTDDLVQVGMVITVAKRLGSILEPDMLVVDEAHHAVAASWKAISDTWTKARHLGVTATPQRNDGRGLGDAFDTMVQAIPMAELIKLGFLAGYDYLAPPQQADLSGIGTRMGDYAVDELAAAMDKSVITGDAVSHYRDHLQGRPAIAFCVSIAHAEHVAEQFQAAGYRAASVDGKLDPDIRARRIAMIGDGRLQVLTSCDLISEGTDIPAVAGAILLRPTKSTGMFLQQCGRVLRVKSDGSRAIILDHVGNVHRHGLPDMPREWSLEAKKKKGAAPPTATCKACFQVFAVRAGWQQEPCEGEAGCLFGDKEAAERTSLEVVEGYLEPVSDVWAWAGGINPYSASGPEYQALLAKADTEERLKQVAKARGYHAKWVWHLMNTRQTQGLAA